MKQAKWGSRLALTLEEGVAVGATAHATTSYLLAINVLRRDLRRERLMLWEMMCLPMFLHGTFDFALLSISALNVNIGWIHPTEGISLILTMALAIGMPLTTLVIRRYKTRKHYIRWGIKRRGVLPQIRHRCWLCDRKH
jgi:hypothetical protein